MSSWSYALTNKGRQLQAKAQAGAQLVYTRMAIGRGSLSGQSLEAMTTLITPVKDLTISRIKRPAGATRAIIGAALTNQDVTTGFHLREIGIFATDPDDGEILYMYANAGATADYIAPKGDGTIEKSLNFNVFVGSAANITANIDESLVYVTKQELDDALEGITIEDASTAQKGIVQLSSATNSTSENLAATPKAVKAAYDRAVPEMNRLSSNFKGPDAPMSDYPEGITVFYVGGGTGGVGSAWKTATGATESFGFVETMRAGGGGYQIFTEMYSGNDATNKTNNKQYKRNKRDSNAFWQTFERIMDEDDYHALQTGIDEAKQAGDERKQQTVDVLIAKGVAASTAEPWDSLIAKLTALIKATGNATVADLLSGKTASNASGPITGTLAPRVPNLIKNGSFENEANGWSHEGAVSYAFPTGTGRFGNRTLHQNVTSGHLFQSIPSVAGHIYYFGSWSWFNTLTNAYTFCARVVDIDTGVSHWNNVASPLVTTWQYSSIRITSNSSRLAVCAGVWGDSRTVSTNLDGLILIDLTEVFGVGKEPDKATMDAIVQANGGWWDSVLPIITSDTTATAAQILANQTAYLDGVKVTGTAINRSGSYQGTNIPAAASVTSGVIDIKPFAGLWDGNTYAGIYDPNFKASNIANGVSVFGLVGTAIAFKAGYTTTLYQLTTTTNVDQVTSYKLIKALIISNAGVGGTVVFTFTIKGNIACAARIYVDGVQTATRTASTAGQTYSDVLTVKNNSVIDIYVISPIGATQLSAISVKADLVIPTCVEG